MSNFVAFHRRKNALLVARIEGPYANPACRPLCAPPLAMARLPNWPESLGRAQATGPVRLLDLVGFRLLASSGEHSGSCIDPSSRIAPHMIAPALRK